MFAVRVDPKKRNKIITHSGHVWVKSADHEFYVTVEERGIFETKEEAEHARTEKWEIIVNL